jgi:Bacterial protein of unknown function (HtrL_YibB)
MTTFVSGFLANANNRKDRTIEKYIDYGNKFVDLPVNKIIFLEKEIYDQYFKNKDNETTKFILFNKSDIYLYNYKDKVTNFNICTDNKNKDTLDYMFTICNKTEWIRQAIELNLYQTDQFIWIDFGLFHVINDDDKYRNAILKMSEKKYDKVRIAACWDLNRQYARDIYRQIAWYFVGGVFGGEKKMLLLFAELMKNKCISIINDKKTIMWEVNVWYLVYLDFPGLFSPYKSNHNLSILEQY